MATAHSALAVLTFNFVTFLTNLGSHIEPEQNHVAVAYNIIFPFEANLPRFTSFRQGTGGNQVVIGNRFSGDKTALEIGMDSSGSSCCFFAGVNGPRARFLFAGGKKRAQAEQMINGPNECVHAG